MSTTTSQTDTVTAPNDIARHKLRHATVEELIQAVIVLTHQVHGRDDEASDDKRAQREHVIVEIKRRAAVSS